MQALSILFLAVGVIVLIVGAIGMLIAAFHEGIGWGLGCLLLPIVTLIFTVVHWDEAKKPFLTKLAGAGLVVVGVLLSPTK